MHAGESAINKGLANRLAELEVEREERDRAELEEECGIEADTYEALPDPAEDATEGLRHDVNNLTHFVDRDRLATRYLPGGVEIPMGCDQPLGRQASRSFERVNVLCEAAQQQALVVEQLDKAVGSCGSKATGP